jgi:hypothetical protein
LNSCATAPALGMPSAASTIANANARITSAVQ